MRINKIVRVAIPQGESKGTFYLNVPINVKTIKTKSMVYLCDTVPNPGEGLYGYVESDLTQNQPMGIFYQDSTYPIDSANDVVYQLSRPQPITGTFTFSLFTPAGIPFTGSAVLDYLLMILEFDSGDDSLL